MTEELQWYSQALKSPVATTTPIEIDHLEGVVRGTGILPPPGTYRTVLPRFGKISEVDLTTTSSPPPPLSPWSLELPSSPGAVDLPIPDLDEADIDLDVPEIPFSQHTEPENAYLKEMTSQWVSNVEADLSYYSDAQLQKCLFEIDLVRAPVKRSILTQLCLRAIADGWRLPLFPPLKYVEHYIGVHSSIAARKLQLEKLSTQTLRSLSFKSNRDSNLDIHRHIRESSRAQLIDELSLCIPRYDSGLLRTLTIAQIKDVARIERIPLVLRAGLAALKPTDKVTGPVVQLFTQTLDAKYFPGVEPYQRIREFQTQADQIKFETSVNPVLPPSHILDVLNPPQPISVDELRYRLFGEKTRRLENMRLIEPFGDKDMTDGFMYTRSRLSTMDSYWLREDLTPDPNRRIRRHVDEFGQEITVGEILTLLSRPSLLKLLQHFELSDFHGTHEDAIQLLLLCYRHRVNPNRFKNTCSISQKTLVRVMPRAVISRYNIDPQIAEDRVGLLWVLTLWRFYPLALVPNLQHYQTACRLPQNIAVSLVKYIREYSNTMVISPYRLIGLNPIQPIDRVVILAHLMNIKTLMAKTGLMIFPEICVDASTTRRYFVENIGSYQTVLSRRHPPEPITQDMSLITLYRILITMSDTEIVELFHIDRFSWISRKDLLQMGMRIYRETIQAPTRT